MAILVRPGGLEPPRLTATDFKSVMATNYITVALVGDERVELSSTDYESDASTDKLIALGALSEIRTQTVWLLRPLPLPIALRGHIWCNP